MGGHGGNTTYGARGGVAGVSGRVQKKKPARRVRQKEESPRRRAWVNKHLVALLVPVLRRAGREDVVSGAKAAARADGSYKKSVFVKELLRAVYGRRLEPGAQGDWHKADLSRAEGDPRFEAFMRATVRALSGGACAYAGPVADLWYRPPPSRADGVPNQEFTLNFALWDALPGLDAASLTRRLARGLPLPIDGPEAAGASTAPRPKQPAPAAAPPPAPAVQGLDRLQTLDEMRPFLENMYAQDDLTQVVGGDDVDEDLEEGACCSKPKAVEGFADLVRLQTGELEDLDALQRELSLGRVVSLPFGDEAFKPVAKQVAFEEPAAAFDKVLALDALFPTVGPAAQLPAYYLEAMTAMTAMVNEVKSNIDMIVELEAEPLRSIAEVTPVEAAAVADLEAADFGL